MALAGRSARRGGAGIRWITIGVAITLLVLLIDASVQSRSPAPQQQLATGTWVDRILPLISSSTVEGQTLAAIWSGGLKMPGSAVSEQIDSVTTGAAANYQAAIKLRPPLDLAGPAGLLEACLLARSEAADQLKSTLTSVLGAAAETASSSAAAASASIVGRTSSTSRPAGTPSSSTTTTTVPAPAAPPATVIQAVQKAGGDIQVGDQAYQLFTGSLPASLGIKMPASTWGSNLGPYQPQQAQVFLTSLQNAAVTAPVHQVKIYAITTNPGPVANQGTTEVMPDASAMTVTAVIADTGNQPEDNLTVTASIAPVGQGTSSVRDFLNLQPGQAYTIAGLGPLDPVQGPTETLTVDVASSSGVHLATSTITFEMPAPPPPTTTTTTRTSTTT